MGSEYHCDFCRKGVPLETALKKIVIGDQLVAEACITCGSRIASALKTEVANAVAQMNTAAAATPAALAAAPPTAPPVPQPGDPITPPPPPPGAD